MKKQTLKIITLAVFFLLPIIFLYPALEGKLFYFKNRAKIPGDYHQVIEFFKNQEKNTRIANLPQPTFWGWTLYRWNYSGSGFLWYGIEQPILDRAFDPWSDKNENYYWEISYALYSQNQELFEKVLEKYQVSWLLVDENVINPTSPKALYFDELGEILSASDKISLSQQFGQIKIYQVDLENSVKDFVFLAKNLPAIGPKYDWNNYDVAYLEKGDYISLIGNSFYYPFRSLFTGRGQEDLEFEIEEKESHFIFRQTLPEEIENYRLEIPKVKTEELVWVDPDDLSQLRYLKPEVRFDGEVVEVIVPRVGGYYSAEIDPISDPLVQTAKSCNPFGQGEIKNEIIGKNGQQLLRLTSVDANINCITFWLPNLPHKFSYLITAESQNQASKSLLFWLENLNIRKADIETYLPKKTGMVKNYFIQPPMEEDGLGYTIHFDNISIGREKTVNDLGKITVNPIPFDFLTSLKLVSPQTLINGSKSVITSPVSISHPNPSFYQVTLEPSDEESILILSQSFNNGWQAFKVKGRSISRIKNHVLVNNWANGWVLENGESGRIILFFLPQLLEYFGFLLLLIPVALLFIF